MGEASSLFSKAEMRKAERALDVRGLYEYEGHLLCVEITLVVSQK
jgi:hypothetical protein